MLPRFTTDEEKYFGSPILEAADLQDIISHILYSGGLNTKHIGILEVLNSDLQWFDFGMVGHSNSYSYGPDHSKPEPLEIQTKWGHFVWISNCFG